MKRILVNGLIAVHLHIYFVTYANPLLEMVNRYVKAHDGTQSAGFYIFLKSLRITLNECTLLFNKV